MAGAANGWRRVGTPEEGFDYLRVYGERIRSDSALRRILSLAIPPGWTDVEISPDANAKVQAIGYDAVGRRQYIYHPEFVARRSQRKFGKMLPFARSLPRLRAVTNRHLGHRDLGREQVLATVVRLMCRAFFRVGSERYAVRNKTFGIATRALSSHLPARPFQQMVQHLRRYPLLRFGIDVAEEDQVRQKQWPVRTRLGQESVPIQALPVAKEEMRNVRHILPVPLADEEPVPDQLLRGRDADWMRGEDRGPAEPVPIGVDQR